MMAGSEAKVAAREGGDGSVANHLRRGYGGQDVGVLPVPLLPIPNWELKLATLVTLATLSPPPFPTRPRKAPFPPNL